MPSRIHRLVFIALCIVSMFATDITSASWIAQVFIYFVLLRAIAEEAILLLSGGKSLPLTKLEYIFVYNMLSSIEFRDIKAWSEGKTSATVTFNPKRKKVENQ